MFNDRVDAGTQLSKKLLSYKDKDVVVVAIPRGGLPLGAVVAKTLKAPLDVALIKKIGHPFNKEYAIGAVSLQSQIIGDRVHISEDYIKTEIKRLRKVLQKRHDQYYKRGKPRDLKDKVVIIVDDGIATGNTVLATIELIADQAPSAIVLAIPVAPPDAVRKLKRSPLINKVICLLTPYYFRAVGHFYKDFSEVTDKMAIQLLEEGNKD